MSLATVAAAEQIRYRGPISIVKQRLKQLGLEPSSNVWIYPEYPIGWEATVLCSSFVYSFKNDRGRLTLSIEPFIGFYKNGALKRK